MINNEKKIVKAPASKSSSLRAIICCLLQIENKELLIKNISHCQDVKSALNILKEFKHLSYNLLGDDLIIVKKEDYTKREKLYLNVGESGFLARSFVSLARLFANEVLIDGHASIRDRKLAITDFSKQIGLVTDNDLLPITIKGELQGGEYIINEKVSSQFLSGLFFTLPILSEDSIIKIKNLVSRPYFDLTLDYLKRCHIDYLVEDNNFYRIPGRQQYQVKELIVESDWSSMSYLIALGLFRGNVRIVNIIDSPYSPDRVFLNLLDEIGGNYHFSDSSSLNIEKSIIRGFSFDLTSSPDLAPVLVSLALTATSPSKLFNCYRLRNKESDRLKALIDMLTSLQAKYLYQDDCLTIFPSKISGGFIKTYNDHRIAMAGLILSALDKCKITLDNYDCINKSYPDFIKDMEKLGVRL